MKKQAEMEEKGIKMKEKERIEWGGKYEEESKEREEKVVLKGRKEKREKGRKERRTSREIKRDKIKRGVVGKK